jgi:hypothetical protein
MRFTTEAAEKTGHLYKSARATTSEPPKFVKSSKVSALVDEVMQMRPADRELYSITVGHRVYFSGGIEDLATALESEGGD